MRLRNLISCLLTSAAIAVSCVDETTHIGTPKLTLGTDALSFDKEGGEQTVTVAATRDWSVETDAEWIAVNPEKGEYSADPAQVTVSVLANEGMDRSADLKFTINMVTKYLTVSQKGPKGSADQMIIYYNDFDKVTAEKTYGSSNASWPYLDQFDGWKNQTGTGSANVSYSFKAMSARANSNSDSNYSDYPGSGKNNMFFGAAAYFAVKNIALNGTKDIKMTFGTEKYSQELGSIFLNSEYHIWLSNDGSKWVELTDYTFTGGTTEGRWNIAEATFSVPEGTSSLSVCMVVDAASSYRLDDLKLVIADKAGTAVDFSKAVEKDFNDGTTGGNTGDNTGGNQGGNTGGNTGGDTPEGTIFFESFESSLGSFTIDNKNLPSAVSAIWVSDAQYKCAKATAYVSSTQQNHASESWLVSPEIDLTSQTEAYFTFEHAGNYFGTVQNEVFALISKDNGASWTQLDIQEYFTGWSFVDAGYWDLKDYVGKKIKVAFKYVSTATKAGTWEVKNVAVVAGKHEAEPEPEKPDLPAGNQIKVATTATGMTWAADSHPTYGSGFSASANGLKVAYFKHKSTTEPIEAKSDHVRVYKSSALVLTLENGGKFKYISFVTTGGDHCNRYTVPSGEVTVSGNDVVWTGSADSPFVGEMTESQLRIKEITVVYE